MRTLIIIFMLRKKRFMWLNEQKKQAVHSNNGAALQFRRVSQQYDVTLCSSQMTRMAADVTAWPSRLVARQV